MTQTRRPPWLVPPGEIGDIEHKSFTLLCRGHVAMGKVLGVLVYRANWVAENEGIDWKVEPVITVKCEHKDILERVTTISQNSLTTYIKQLVAWGYIEADVYRHRYAVNIQVINETIADPPPALPKKPRGKAAPKSEPSAESQEQERQEKITKLVSQLSNLTTQFSNLGNRITELRNRLANLGFTDLDEGTPEQAFTEVFETDRINRVLKNSKEDSLVVSASAESDGGPSAFLEKISSFEETLEEIQQQEEDRVIIDHLPNGQQVIRRTSGRPLGELIPVGADIQEAIRDLISVEGTRGEIQATVDGKALLDPPSYQREEKGPEGLPRVVALLDATTLEPTEKNTEPFPTQIALLPAVLLSSKGNGNIPSPNKTVERKESKKSFQKIENCSPEIQARRRKWQEHFNQRRGGDRLSTQGECSNESRGIASLVDTYSDGQIEALDHYYYVTHPFWSKPENRRDISGYKLWQKASTARETLKERGRWPARDAPPGQALPQAVPSQQEDPYTRKIRELAAESAARYTTPQAHMQGVAL